MRPVRRGDTVTVRYRIRLEKDRVLEPLAKGEWLTITLGAGTLFPALERTIIGMTPGASNQRTLSGGSRRTADQSRP